MRKLIQKLAIVLFIILTSVILWYNLKSDGNVIIPKGFGYFSFQNDSIYYGKPILVYTYVPSSVRPNSKILILIHGAERRVQKFQAEWQEVADKYNVILVSPYFSLKQFPHEFDFQHGNVIDSDIINGTFELNEENKWAFSFIEPIFRKVKLSLKNKNNTYFLYGHSAGGQFVHRFLLFKPDAKVEKVIFSNSGWYTRPYRKQKYPYGLEDTDVSSADIAKAFAKNVTILLGADDTDKYHFQLKRNKTVDERGLNRFERGTNYFNFCKQTADSMKTPFNWKLSTAPGIEHRNDMMAYFAGELFFKDESTEK